MKRWESVAIVVGCAFVAITALVLRDSPLLPAALVFTGVSTVLGVVDVRERRLPRKIVFPALIAVLGIEAATAITIGEMERLGWAALGAAAAFVALLAIHLVSPNGMGFGDVTYAPLIGATLGWFGLGRVGLGLLLGFLVGAVLAGPLALVKRSGKATFPFGPALGLGAWIALCFGPTLVRWYA